MSQFFDYSIKNRDLIQMVSKEANSKHVMETLHKMFQVIPERVTAFFQTGIDRGLIRSDLDPAMLCDQVLNSFFVQTLFAETNQKFKGKSALDANYRSQLIDQILKSLIEGITVKTT